MQETVKQPPAGEVTPAELIAVTKGLRALGVAYFSYKGCEVTLLPPDVAPIVVLSDDEDEDRESRERRVAAVRKRQMEADLYGATG